MLAQVYSTSGWGLDESPLLFGIGKLILELFPEAWASKPRSLPKRTPKPRKGVGLLTRLGRVGPGNKGRVGLLTELGRES